MIAQCVNCKKYNYYLKNHILDLNTLLNKDMINIILNYINISDTPLKVFHSYKPQPHMICDSCMDHLQTLITVFDTNMMTCPKIGCKRYVFI